MRKQAILRYFISIAKKSSENFCKKFLYFCACDDDIKCKTKIKDTNATNAT